MSVHQNQRTRVLIRDIHLQYLEIHLRRNRGTDFFHNSRQSRPDRNADMTCCVLNVRSPAHFCFTKKLAFIQNSYITWGSTGINPWPLLIKFLHAATQTFHTETQDFINILLIHNCMSLNAELLTRQPTIHTTNVQCQLGPTLLRNMFWACLAEGPCVKIYF